MQYWADAGTELLPAMAQIGRHTEVTHEVIMRVRRIAFLLVFKSTGWVIFAEFGFTEAYSTFEHVLINGSESHGVIKNEQIIVQMKTETKSLVSMTSAFLNLSSCL